MSGLDYTPSGGQRHKADPAYAKKIREGGKRADVLRRQSDHQHKTLEVPVAEKQLMEELNALNRSKK